MYWKEQVDKSCALPIQEDVLIDQQTMLDILKSNNVLEAMAQFDVKRVAIGTLVKLHAYGDADIYMHLYLT